MNARIVGIIHYCVVMKKVVAGLRDYFGVSQREARGLLVLLSLISFLVLLPLLYRSWAPDRVPDLSDADKRQLDSLVALLEATKQPALEQRDQKTTPFRKTFDSRQGERFTFDPNTIDVQGWQRLGLPSWLAERIDRYRAKGGQFRRKEDLLRIYDFPPHLYEELEPYIQLSAELKKSPRQFAGHQERADYKANLYNAGGQNHYAPSSERTVKAALQPFDINTADTTDLKKLRGIGSKLAGRIVKFRDALGGFTSASQYAEVFGLDSLALQELAKYAQVQSPVRRIAINAASADELDKHVYLSKRQAEIIVNYRNQHGPFASLESLRPIRVLDGKTLEKIGPYLAF